MYNGLASAKQLEPRLGIAYNIKPTNTVLRVSYARTMESPFNENLIIASTGCNDPVIFDFQNRCRRRFVLLVNHATAKPRQAQ